MKHDPDHLFDLALRTNLEAMKAQAQAEGIEFLESQTRACAVAETLLPIVLGKSFKVEWQSDVAGFDENGEPEAEYTIVIRPIGDADFISCSMYYRPDSVVEAQLGEVGTGWSVIVARQNEDSQYQHESLLQALRMAGVLKEDE